jgi:hypothetical protein
VPRCAVQILIVQYGGQAFNTVPLQPQLWLYAMVFGAFGWVVRQGLLAIPTKSFDLENLEPE